MFSQALIKLCNAPAREKTDFVPRRPPPAKKAVGMTFVPVAQNQCLALSPVGGEDMLTLPELQMTLAGSCSDKGGRGEFS